MILIGAKKKQFPMANFKLVLNVFSVLIKHPVFCASVNRTAECTQLP